MRPGNACIAILLMGLCAFSFAAWEMKGPPGGRLRSVVMSKTNDNILYATSYSSPTYVFKSTNAGTTWEEVGSYSSYNYSLAIDQSENLYAGYYGRIYKSTNGGVSWTYTTVASTYPYDLEVHPTNPNIIYGCGRRYVSSGNYAMTFIKSTNAGASWTTLDLVSGGYCYGYGIGVDPNNPSIVYCGGSSYGTTYEPKIFKSTDGGASFNQVYSCSTGYYVYDIAVHPSNSSIVYMCTYYDGIYRSIDGGTSWTKVSTLNYNYRLGTTQANHDYVYCAGYTYFRRSTNAGVTWVTAENGLCGYSNMGLAVTQSTATGVYVANYAGMFRTTNSGTNWFMSSEGIMLGLPVVAATVAPSNADIVYCQVEDIGVFKTTNCGTKWVLCPEFSSCGDMCAIAVKHDDPNTVMAIEGLG